MNMSSRFAVALVACCTMLAATPVRAEFLFVTFVGEGSEQGEQIYFGLSTDGSHWTAPHGQKPVLESEVGERGARDPYLLRGENGRFYLLATDLSIFRNHNWGRAVRDGSRSLLIWESTDLVRWERPRLTKVAPDDAGCTWAPQAIYDQASKRYLVYWASTTRRDEFAKHRIWGAWTEDFLAFSEPFIYIENPTAVIDTDIVQGDDGKYYRFTKDEQYKAITFETSDGVTGQWQAVPGFSLARERGFEGPACFTLKPRNADSPAVWCLLLDAYARGTGYQPFVTANLGSGQFTPGEGFSFPFRFRHGSVLPVSSEEYETLLRHLDGGEVAP
ncbi:MAG: glycoside hydrolase family 43 protein [Planctomycetales bacterium]|nr:glycoside hydrolase family 43 protein [Planctomycetales bacterium]